MWLVAEAILQAFGLDPDTLTCPHGDYDRDAKGALTNLAGYLPHVEVQGNEFLVISLAIGFPISAGPRHTYWLSLASC